VRTVDTVPIVVCMAAHVVEVHSTVERRWFWVCTCGAASRREFASPGEAGAAAEQHVRVADAA
jgi:hypothetical protein